jgi:hypothetical protein
MGEDHWEPAWGGNGSVVVWACTAHHRKVHCAECDPAPMRAPSTPTGPRPGRRRRADAKPQTERQKRAEAQRAARGAAYQASRVSIRDGVPTCSKCGGTQFTARRKTSTKVMFGLASLAGRPHHVECDVCGQL